jgi:hypothetical protein
MNTPVSFSCLAALRTGAACLGGGRFLLFYRLKIDSIMLYVFVFLPFPPPTIISFSRAAFLTTTSSMPPQEKNAQWHTSYQNSYICCTLYGMLSSLRLNIHF